MGGERLGAFLSAAPRLRLPRIRGGGMAELVLTLVGFSVLNIWLNWFNSWAEKPRDKEFVVPGFGWTLRCGGFQFPFFYSLFHTITSTLGSYTVLRILGVKHPTRAEFLEYKWGLLPCAFLFSVNVAANNASLVTVSILVNSVVKSLGPIPTMVAEYFVNRTVPTRAVVASVIVLITGAILCVDPKGGSSTLGGVLLVVLATCSASIRPVFASALMSGKTKPRLHPASVLFYEQARRTLAAVDHRPLHPPSASSASHTSAPLAALPCLPLPRPYPHPAGTPPAAAPLIHHPSHSRPATVALSSPPAPTQFCASSARATGGGNPLCPHLHARRLEQVPRRAALPRQQRWWAWRDDHRRGGMHRVRVQPDDLLLHACRLRAHACHHGQLHQGGPHRIGRRTGASPPRLPAARAHGHRNAAAGCTSATAKPTSPASRMQAHVTGRLRAPRITS